MEIRKIYDVSQILKTMDKFNKWFVKPLDNNKLIELASKFENNANFFGIFLDEEVVGYIAFYSNDLINKTSYISQIVVDNNYRNNGLGNILLKKCINISKASNMKYIELMVYKNNESAIRFYKKNNFNIIEEFEEKFKLRRSIV